MRELESIFRDPDRIRELEDSGVRQSFGERMDAISAELRKAKASAKLVSARASAVMDALEGPAFAELDVSDVLPALTQGISIFEKAYDNLVAAGKADLVLEFPETPAA